MSLVSSVKGGEIASISQNWKGKASKSYLSTKFSIASGDLRVQWDCDASTTTSVSLYIASGEDVGSPGDKEYLMVEVKRDGSTRCVGYHGENEISDDDIELEKDPEINYTPGAQRWQVCVWIPFFYLPSPGGSDDDDLMLKWHVNVLSDDGLSLSTLPTKETKNGAEDNVNPHQLAFFSELLISDADSTRLRSISRASIVGRGSYMGQKSTMDRFLKDVANSPEAKKASISASEIALSAASADLELCSNIPEVVSKLRDMFPLTAEENALALAEDGDISKQLGLLLRDGEEVLRAAKLWRRRGWSHKKIVLVLTANLVECRLHVFSRKSKKFERTLPWSNTRPLAVEAQSEVRFDLECIYEQKEGGGEVCRKYHYFDEGNTGVVEKFVASISAISNTRERYVLGSLGAPAHEALKAQLRKTKKESMTQKYCVIA
jgi:hypothetical protein